MACTLFSCKHTSFPDATFSFPSATESLSPLAFHKLVESMHNKPRNETVGNLSGMYNFCVDWRLITMDLF